MYIEILNHSLVSPTHIIYIKIISINTVVKRLKCQRKPINNKSIKVDDSFIMGDKVTIFLQISFLLLFSCCRYIICIVYNKYLQNVSVRVKYPLKSLPSVPTYIINTGTHISMYRIIHTKCPPTSKNYYNLCAFFSVVVGRCCLC